MQASTLLVASFSALAVTLAVAVVGAVYWSGRRSGLNAAVAGRGALLAAAGATLWLALTFAAARSGALSFTSRPPTMIGLLGAIGALAFGLGFSRVGTRLATALPLAVLVGFQGFRILVELLMHRAYVEGLMPVQMSYSGRNFDIVSGITAVVVGILIALGKAPRPVVLAWNLLGVGLLLNVLTIAILSAPLPIRVFHNEPANVWVTEAPWVWLPAVMVLLAILGHILVFRRLRADSRG